MKKILNYDFHRSEKDGTMFVCIEIEADQKEKDT
jgi:hypothetical protein